VDILHDDNCYNVLKNVLGNHIGLFFVIPIAQELVSSGSSGLWGVFGYSIYYINSVETLEEYRLGQHLPIDRYSHNGIEELTKICEASVVKQSYIKLLDANKNITTPCEVQNYDKEKSRVLDFFILDYLSTKD